MTAVFVLVFFVLPMLYVLSTMYLAPLLAKRSALGDVNATESVRFKGYALGHRGLSYFGGFRQSGNGFLVVTDERVIFRAWAIWPLLRFVFEAHLDDITQTASRKIFGFRAVQISTADHAVWFLPYKWWFWPSAEGAHRLATTLSKRGATA